MICRVCGADKPITPEYWYYRNNGKPDGKVCKKCRRGGEKVVAICRHCHAPILNDKGEPVDPQTHYHQDQAHAACIQAKRLKHLHDMREWDRAHGRSRKRKEGLSACQAKRGPRRIEKFLRDEYGHLDGDWIYC